MVQRSVDPQLLAELTVRGVLPRLVGRAHPAGGDVPCRRPQVLRGASAMHEHRTRAVEHSDEYRAVTKATGSHLTAADDPGHLAGFVDDLDPFICKAFTIIS
ncbi:MAG: hypothetical protein R2698_02750 [Microthrixaceae bacterium]